MGGGHNRQSSSSKGGGGGGYVGGFLQLFDWNAKSRKKLFSNKSDNPDQSKQKKRSDGNLPTTRFNLVEMDVDEYVGGGGSSFKGSSEYSCASSVTDEEGFGASAKAGPSVVARLMGLDSMPPPISSSSNLSEQQPFSTPFYDSQSPGESQYARRQKLEFRPDNHNNIVYSGNLRNKVDAPIIQKAQKTMNRPIEKFQSEILPSKSAKTIPITHHKLLSPIKSPGFISSNNAAHIMEAAVKIIEPGTHQASSTSKTKMPSVGSLSSVPFKVRELREKVEASQKPSRRPLESNAAKVLKGQPMNKSWNGSPDSEDRLGANNKGKSISLALQAKVNVQKREGRKEPTEVTLIHPYKSQSSNRKSIPRKPPTQNNSDALKQNNQKQNCPIDKQKLNSKSLVSNSQIRSKISSGDSSSGGTYKSSGKNGGNSKVGSRKLSPEANDSKQEVLYSSTKNVPRKRRSLDGNYNNSKDMSHVFDNMLVDKDEKQLTWAEESKREGMDVVSFTFTTPLSRNNNVFGSDYYSSSNKAMLSSDFRNDGKLASVECNVIGADDLSILLEQKLRDLTRGVAESSSRYREEYSGTSSSAPSFDDFAPNPKPDASISSSMLCKKKKQDKAVQLNILCGKESSNFTSTGSKGLVTKYKLQGTMEVEGCRSDDTETRKSLHFRHPSPISVLDPSFMSESWNSSDTVDSMKIEGSKHSSSVQALEVLGVNSYRNPHFMEIDTEFADSASSSSTKAFQKGKKVAISMTTFDNIKSKWELQYVNEILFNVELMFEDFSSGRTHEIINPHIFDQLENRKEILEENSHGNKIERKAIFDCVRESMDLRCNRYSDGGFKMWAKGLETLKRKECLAKDVYKEISIWKGGIKEDNKVDDLVDKDMSSQYGKWLDFEAEAFEIGVQIEGRILSSLINEMVADLVIR